MAHDRGSWTAGPARGWRLVHARGELDLSTAQTLTASLDAAVTAPSDVHVVVDLSEVTFIDCAGLRPLLQTRNLLRDRFWLYRVSAPVARLLDLTALTDAFACLDHLPGLSRSRPDETPWLTTVPRPRARHRLRIDLTGLDGSARAAGTPTDQHGG